MILDYIFKVSINSITIYKKTTCKYNDEVIENNRKIQPYEINSPKQNNINTTGERILMLTREMKIKQLYLAEIIGNTGATLSRYENYKIPPKDRLSIKLSKAVGVSDISNKFKFYSSVANEQNKEYLKQAYKKFFMYVRIYNRQKYTPKRFNV